MKHVALIATALLGPMTLEAGAITEAFGAGVRGVPWSNPCAPDKVLPGGKWREAAGVRMYTIRDSRAVMHVERDRRSEIHFTCTHDRTSIASITITFPNRAESYGSLLASLRQQFGEPLEVEAPTGAPHEQLFSAFVHRWPVDDGLSMRLIASITGLSRSTSVIIERQAERPGGRIELGLE